MKDIATTKTFDNADYNKELESYLVLFNKIDRDNIKRDIQKPDIVHVELLGTSQRRVDNHIYTMYSFRIKFSDNYIKTITEKEGSKLCNDLMYLREMSKR